MSPEDVQRVFRQLYLVDLEVGECRSEADYRALFPGHEDAISEQLARFDEVSTRSAIDGERIAAAPVGFSGAPGEKLGRYRIQREIGRGGQAIVYQAEDEGLQRQVALKVLTGLGPAPRACWRFRREAEIASRLDHPGICTVYEAGVASGVPFIGDAVRRRRDPVPAHLAPRARHRASGSTFEEEVATEGEVELPRFRADDSAWSRSSSGRPAPCTRPTRSASPTDIAS
ncbi:MAG: hypothetical protein R3F20_18565 [Planctomycetota bacterium]